VALNLVNSDEGEDGLLEFAKDRLVSFSFIDNENRVNKCEVTFRNTDKTLLDDPRLKSGQEYIVQWGYADRMSSFPMIVKGGKESGRNFILVLKGKEVELDKGRKYRQWIGSRDSDVVREIFDEYGFAGVTSDVVDTPVNRPTITQSTSDARFIQKLARRNKFRWWIDASGAHFRHRKKDGDPYKWYTYRGYFKGDGDILSPGPNIDTNFATDVARYKVRAIDPYTLKEVVAEYGIEGGEADEEYDVALGEEQEIGDPDNLEGNRQKRVTRSEEVDGGFATQDEVNAMAEAMYREVSDRRYKMRLPVRGDPHLGAKMLIGLRNYSEGYSGLYYVKKVTHSISGGRFRCDADCVRDALKRVYFKKKKGVKGKKNPNRDPGGENGPPKPDTLVQITTTKPGPNNEVIWIRQWVKPGTNFVVKEQVLSESLQRQLDGLQ
jgi:phage protein D